MTGRDDYAEKFSEAEEKLKAVGWAVLNPTKNDGFKYKDYIDMGLNELSKCNAIYMLKGWEKSPGARLEYQYAKTVGLLVIDEVKDEQRTIHK